MGLKAWSDPQLSLKEMQERRDNQRDGINLFPPSSLFSLPNTDP